MGEAEKPERPDAAQELQPSRVSTAGESPGPASRGPAWTSRGWARWWTPVAGLVLAAAGFVGTSGGSLSYRHEPPVDLVTRTATQGTPHAWRVAVMMMGCAALTAFVPGLAARIRRAEGAADHIMSGLVSVTGTALIAILVALLGMYSAISVYTQDLSVSLGTLVTMVMVYDGILFGSAVAATGLALLAAGAAVLLTHALPRWLGWLAVMAGLLPIFATLAPLSEVSLETLGEPTAAVVGAVLSFGTLYLPLVWVAAVASALAVESWKQRAAPTSAANGDETGRGTGPGPHDPVNENGPEGSREDSLDDVVNRLVDEALADRPRDPREDPLR